VLNEGHPAVAYSETSKVYLVVREDERNYAAWATDIYGRLVGAEGVPTGPDFRVPKSGGHEDLSPAVAWNGSEDDFPVVWSDSRDAEDHGSEIYGRLVAG